MYVLRASMAFLELLAWRCCNKIQILKIALLVFSSVFSKRIVTAACRDLPHSAEGLFGG